MQERSTVWGKGVISLTDDKNIFGSMGFYCQDNSLSRQTFVRLGGTFISGLLLAQKKGWLPVPTLLI